MFIKSIKYSIHLILKQNFIIYTVLNYLFIIVKINYPTNNLVTLNYTNNLANKQRQNHLNSLNDINH